MRAKDRQAIEMERQKKGPQAASKVKRRIRRARVARRKGL